MKKLVLTSAIAASSLFAATDAQILGFYNQILPQGISASIVSREKLAGNEEFEGVVLKLTDGKASEDEVIFTKGDLLLPDILDLKSGKSYKGEMKEKLVIAGLSKIYASEDKANVIVLGNDPKKPTQVMFSDPECPYCRMELQNIEKRLEKENVKMILTPVHDKSSLEKSFLIYKDVKNAKSDSEKVKILRKYFGEKFEVPAGSVTDAQVNQMEQLRRKYLNSGLRSVPFFVEETKLLGK